MKKMFLFAAMASVAFASCTTDESVFDGAPKDGEIKFVAANYVAQTRGEHDINVAFSNNDYAVWAWKVGTAEVHMNMQNVQVNKSNEIQGDGTYWWPENYGLDFASVSPYNNPSIGLKRTSGNTTITFTFDGDTKQTDNTTNLMYANKEYYQYDYSAAGDQPVALKFRHALAKLNAVVHQADPATTVAGVAGYEVIVKSLKMTGIKSEGSLVVNLDEVNIGTTDKVWTDAASPTTTDEWTIISTDTSIKASDYKYTTDFYVMPQNIGDATKLVVDYDVITTFEGGGTSTINKTKTVNVKDIIATGGSTPLANWYTNKIVTYTINISPNEAFKPIKFTAMEEEWGTQSGSTTISQGTTIIP